MWKCHFCTHDHGPLMSKPEECSTCRDFNNFQVKKRMSQRQMYEYERLRKEEEWANDHSVNFDRDTAAMLLKDILRRMYRSSDKFGNKTMAIRCEEFEFVLKKYLSGKEVT